MHIDDSILAQDEGFVHGFGIAIKSDLLRASELWMRRDLKSPRVKATWRAKILSLSASALLLLAACGGDSSGDNPFLVEEEEMGADGGGPALKPPRAGEDVDGDGWLDEVEALIRTDHLKPDVPCASQRYTIEETLHAPKADFVFVVDSSGSMVEELPLIQSGLQTFFGPLLSSAQIDFRVIYIASFNHTGSFCLFEDGDCLTDAPSRTERFAHYDRRVNSFDALSTLLATYLAPDQRELLPGGWSEMVREGAELVITVITDDESEMNSEEFLSDFRQTDSSGLHHDADGEPRYTFHSIVGVPQRGNAEPWPATSALQTKACASARRPGLEYQRLSQLTGGLRFSICQSADYGAMLEQSVREIFDKAYIPCVFPLPRAERDSERPSSETLALQLDQQGAASAQLKRVASLSECDRGDFYVTRAPFNDSAVRLCPQRCEAIQGSKNVTLRVATSCVDASCGATLPTHTGSCAP